MFEAATRPTSLRGAGRRLRSAGPARRPDAEYRQVIGDLDLMVVMDPDLQPVAACDFCDWIDEAERWLAYCCGEPEGQNLPRSA